MLTPGFTASRTAARAFATTIPAARIASSSPWVLTSIMRARNRAIAEPDRIGHAGVRSAVSTRSVISPISPTASTVTSRSR